MRRSLRATAMILVLVLAVHGCETALTPEPIIELELSPTTVSLSDTVSQQITIRNVGAVAAGPIEIGAAGAFVAAGGSSVPGLGLRVSPSDIPTLNPGDERTVVIGTTATGPVQDGLYQVTVHVRVADSIRVSFHVSASIQTHPLTPQATVEISGGPTQVRQGDVVTYTIEARDSTGALVADPAVIWSVAPGNAGFIGLGGRFVAYETGVIGVIATVGQSADTLEITAAARGLTGRAVAVGAGSVSARYSSDLWVHGTAAYTGTWGSRAQIGNTLYTWDVSNPASPALSDSVRVDARVVNDVKVRADGQLAVLTHEGSQDGKNGVTLLDLADPLHPVAIGRVTTTLETGVHNAWIEGNYLYLVVDGVSPASGLRILDVSDPANPIIAATYYEGSSFLHDVYVRKGLAFLSHWNAGLQILDVGNGVVGGSPPSPKRVGGILTQGGQTHNVWYWPDAGYAFVGEEDFSTPGIMHVIDVRDLAHPKEVATYRSPGTTPHNFWLDESTGVLYLAWYGNGIRALDVTGELMGELEKQGREIFGEQYAGSGACPATGTDAPTCTWAPQYHHGLLYLADMNAGLRIFRPIIP